MSTWPRCLSPSLLSIKSPNARTTSSHCTPMLKSTADLQFLLCLLASFLCSNDQYRPNHSAFGSPRSLPVKLQVRLRTLVCHVFLASERVGGLASSPCSTCRAGTISTWTFYCRPNASPRIDVKIAHRRPRSRVQVSRSMDESLEEPHASTQGGF
jgi:hypothetical protein